MKVLIVSHKPPFPVNDGGTHAMMQFLNLLLPFTDQIDYLFASTHKHHYEAGAFPEYENVKWINCPIDTRVKGHKIAHDIIRGDSPNLSRFRDADFRVLSQKMIESEGYDLIILEGIVQNEEV